MISIHGLHFNNIKGDIYGGLTAAVVALPLAMAMGVTSGAGPVAGLYGAILCGFFAALFGGTAAQVSGPTGPMTVVMAVIFTQYTSLFPDNPAQGAAMAFTVVLLGGGFQILFGLLKFGHFIRLIPYPVISGFMSGIGVIIILLQLQPLLGHAAESHPLAALHSLPTSIAEPVFAAVLLATVTLIIVYGLPKRIGALLPPPVFALIIGTVGLYWYAGGEVIHQVVDESSQYHLASAAIIGAIPSGFPQLMLPTFEVDMLIQMIKSALILATLGSIDSLLTSLVADTQTRTCHDSNRELIGQGVGNMVAGVFGGLPGAGATMRTVANIRAGGRTPISGALHALLLLGLVLGLGKSAEFIPLAVLAGILVKVGTDIIDWRYLACLHRAPRSSTLLMLAVFLLTVFVDLIYAVAIGMIIAAFIFMKRMADLQMTSMHIITGAEQESALSPAEQALIQQMQGKVLVCSLEGPRSFPSARSMIYTLAKYHDFEILIFDFSKTSSIDFTSCLAIAEIVEGLQSDSRQVYFAGLSTVIRETLEKIDSLQQYFREHTFGTCSQALTTARDDLWSSATHQSCIS